MTTPPTLTRRAAPRGVLLALLLAASAVADAGPFRTVAGSTILLKVVAATDGVRATVRPDTTATAFELELLRPYFVVEERDGYYLVAESQAERSRRGWVETARVRTWSTREGLDLDATAFLADERPWLAAWHERTALEAYARTGDRRRRTSPARSL